MSHLVTRGLVLREVNYKDSDKILTVLLEGQGKRTVQARGCRRSRSSLSAAAQLLVWSDMTLSSHRDRYFLRDASTLNEFRGIRSDLDRLTLGSYFVSVTEAAAEEGVETPGLLALTLNALYALDKLPRPLSLIKAAFELKTACLIGYEPLLNACTVCGAPNPERPTLYVREGVLCCAQCQKAFRDSGPSLPLDVSSLTAMRYVAYGDSKRLFSFSLPSQSLEIFSHVCEEFLLTQLGQSFRTLEFYKSLGTRQPENIPSPRVR